MWCACMGICVCAHMCTCMHMCAPFLHCPWGTYIIDEICHVRRAAGQCAGRWGAHPAEWGIAAQWWLSQRGAQGCQLGWVAQLADVIGILQTKSMDLSLD